MRGDSAAIMLALALVAFVLWLLISQRERVRYPSRPAIVMGEFAMERKIQLVIALIILTGISLMLYGFSEPNGRRWRWTVRTISRSSERSPTTRCCA